MSVLLETSVGDIVIDLKLDEAPQTCLNFLKLCKLKYYNNCLVFRVEKDYIAQTGDPRNTGLGGVSLFSKLPGGQKFFKDEISPLVKHTVKGTVAMANEKPNENASQFYFTLRADITQLDQKHTIFGTVAEGLDVLDKMNSTMVDDQNAPYQNIRIWHTEVLDDPLPDPDGLERLIPPKSPEVIKDEVFKSIDDAQDEAELDEKMAKTLAKSQATTLELLHDLPDADIEVPENDLFVTCMNPVTQDGDLELIFSRFGPIKSCEIVRDWKTGDSLQYGFIIFENARDCEEAYFKMHDCVIDDRRIVVNFSQSVAKLWNKHRTGVQMSASEAKEMAKGGKDRTKGKGKGGGGGKGKGKTADPFMAKQEDTRGKKGPGMVFEGTDKADKRGGRDDRQKDGGRDRSRGRGERERDSARDRGRGRSPPAKTRGRSRSRSRERRR